jgi:predicted ATPase
MPNNIDSLHNIACFVGALASACEKSLGSGSLSVCSVAGKKFGASVVEEQSPVADPLAAINSLQKALAERGIVWDFEPFPGEDASAAATSNGRQIIRLVFRTCMVRNALFRYAHEQKQSLCYMAHGVFAGALEKILTGKKATLEIVHAGPNACLKELILEDAP